ncbi:MAG: ABC transporter permease [Clostridia bacterium]|nr:ABC transporter permease [Clostridia bacterium]
MALYIGKRLLQAIIVLIGITFVTFLLINVVPGDPVLIMMGQRADPNAVERMRHNLGMDLPLLQQYGRLIMNTVRFDLGRSYYTKELVTVALARRAAVTLQVALFSYIIAMVVGIITGVYSAVKRGKWQDRTCMSLIVVFMSAPAFWVALLLQIVFGLMLRWLPISGLNSPAAYVLPCVSLGLRYAATTARFTRTSMLDVIGQDYVRTARAKGLKEWVVICSHALKNALIPIVTMAGFQLGSLMSGAMLTETVFNIPGIGSLIVDSMSKRDLPLLTGGVIYVSMVFVVMNLIVDVLYAVIDPRIRVSSKKAVAL